MPVIWGSVIVSMFFVESVAQLVIRQESATINLSTYRLVNDFPDTGIN